MSTDTPLPFLEMCREARQSCRVAGLLPKEWRWGRDVEAASEQSLKYAGGIVWINGPQKLQPPTLPAGALMFYEGLPVFRMAASGVACIGQRTELGIFQLKF